MKTKLYILSLTMIFSHFVIVAQQKQTTNNSTSASTDLPDGVSADWFSKASAVIREMEYEFYPAPQNDHFRVANPKNHIHFLVEPLGYSVREIGDKKEGPGWEVNFIFNGIGREKESLVTAPAFGVIKKKNAITYHAAAIDIEYINNADGLRQNFIIHERPTGKGRVMISLALQTDLEVAVDNKRMFFHTAANAKDVKLYYEDLKVWDANGQNLFAQMQLDKKSGILSIVVDDKNAAYPITVDPLNKTPEWTTSADGILPGLLTNLQLQVQTLYGYTVTGLGDINGDSYDDVSVSAPGMADVITGTGSLTGVGAVFIYLGSSTGLPVVPSKTLQPTTAVTGALFGLSVDAGDVSGDGKNDILIGAPMDRYQTTAAGLLGDVNVNVTAGKVYYYRSEDLFNVANPTPFLQIRLQGNSYFSTIINNISVNSLFGYSVAITNDLNNDGKADIVIGSPAYQGIDLLSLKNGAAFVYYSDNLGTTYPVNLSLPTPTLLGLPLFPLTNSTGLLFGFSVDGIGDYNMDGNPDVVVGAPAGIDLSSLAGIFNGKILAGSAYVYYGNGTGINTAIGAKLSADNDGLLSNAADLFGYKVKGVRTSTRVRNGNILVGAPAGNVVSNVLNGLKVKAGQLHVFIKSNSLPANPTTPVPPSQTINSPRSSSILSILTGQTINVSLLYAASIDNMLDVNCDGIADIIVGEPLSTAIPLIGADIVGGAAYIYLGQGDGTYITTPFWSLTPVVSPLLGVNTTALLGYSVAGGGYTKGFTQGVRAIVGGPSNSLDFGIGLLNLGNTLGTTFDLVFDNNGLGKAYAFSFASCNITLPSTLLEFKGQAIAKTVLLNWTTVTEDNVNFYELQRSIDGIGYQTIAVVFAKNEQRNEYNYTDKHPYSGTNYYRLKTVDNDSRFTYSHVVSVRFNDQVQGDVIVAPNPVVTNDIKVRLIGLDAGTYRMELHNAAGQLIQTKGVKVSQFDQTETMLRSASTPAGIYWLNVYDGLHKRIKSVRILMDKN
ncbi:MAG TPA: integrin alpha [Chitinophagaceae bacterium]